MSTAADTSPNRHRRSRRAESPATPLMIVLSGALLVAIGAGIALHNMANLPSSTDPANGQAGSLSHPTPPEGAALPVRPSSVGGSGRARASRSTAPSRVPVPAIRPTVSPVPVPSPAAVNYEAEAPEVIRSPGVEIRPVATASGGQIVRNIRDGRTVRFVGVAAEGGGDYPMVVFYLARSPQVAQIRVNDGEPLVLTFPALDNDQIGALPVRVPLLVGLNAIEFAGDSPALDRITV